MDHMIETKKEVTYPFRNRWACSCGEMMESCVFGIPLEREFAQHLESLNKPVRAPYVILATNDPREIYDTLVMGDIWSNPGGLVFEEIEMTQTWDGEKWVPVPGVWYQ